MSITSKNIHSEAFSSIDLVHQCLIDPDKAGAFRTALQKTVQKKSSVLEFGTGSGILSLLAAQAGAKSVTAIEFDPYIASVARENIERNGAQNITVITADARTVQFSKDEKFDIIIMEMINTGLVEEMQVQAINNLHSQKLITPATILIPSAQETFMTLANTNFTNHGFEMKMVKHMWSFMPSDVVLLSAKALLNHIDFSQPVSESFYKHLHFDIQRRGKINSIVLSGKTILSEKEGIEVGGTWSMNPDIIIPLPEKTVAAGDAVTVSVEYIFGSGFQNFHVKIIP